MATSSVESTEGGARAAAMEGESTGSEEVVRVLEFALGDEFYCLDIEYVEEIVKRETVTRVPNTPDFVDGVVDLRGQITTILEPKEMMDIESEGEQNLIVVFDPDQFEEQGAVGWVVDEVRQVVPVTESEINRPPVDAEYINGVIDREEHDQFVIWIEPEDALTQATASDEE
jgi:purine-binding chemotaxis protein CheW